MDLKYKKTVSFTPQFSHIDLMGVLWHGHYPKLLEKARDSLFANFNYGYIQMQKDNIVWPIVDMRIKYIKPITLGQEVLITANLVELYNRIKCEYMIHDANDNTLLTKASTTQVAFDMTKKQMLFQTPKFLLELLSWQGD